MKLEEWHCKDCEEEDADDVVNCTCEICELDEPGTNFCWLLMLARKSLHDAVDEIDFLWGQMSWKYNMILENLK